MIGLVRDAVGAVVIVATTAAIDVTEAALAVATRRPNRTEG